MQNLTSLSQTSAGNIHIKAGKSFVLTDTSTGTKYKLVVTDGVLDIVEV